MRSVMTAAPLVSLIVGLAATRTDGYPMPPEFYKLTEEHVSWHIPWAKPYAGGIIKALVIAPRGAQRETIELAQRLGMDYEYVLALSPMELGWTAKSGAYAPADGISNDEMLLELRGKLRKEYDVIIVGHLSWKIFPNDVLYSILKKVHDGTGLVYGYSAFGRTDIINKVLAKGPGRDPQRFVTAGVPFAALPVFDQLGADKVVGLRRFKQGRIVALDFGPKRPRFQYLTPFPPDDVEWYTDLHYEYYMSLVVKSVLWAAKREPSIFVKSWGVDGAAFERAKLGTVSLSASLAGQTVPGRIDAILTVREAGGKAVLQRTDRFVMDGSEKALSFGLASLPQGRYFADLVLRRGKRNVNWATTFFDVEGALRIESVETDREWYEAGQTVKAQIALSAPLPQGAILTVKVVDSLGRLLAHIERAAAVGQKTAACEIEVSNPLTITAQIRATITDGDGTVATASRSFSTVRRQWDDFRFCVWTAGSQFNERVRRLMFEHLIDAGVDTFTNSSRSAVSARRAAELGYWGIPYMTRYHYSGKELVRKPCLTDPKFLKAHLAQLEQTTRVQRPFDPQGYTLGDECFFSRGHVDACFSPTCNADLREWLRDEYASVEALNASWGTTYNSFDEAEPITLADAKEKGQIPRWVDHRRHMEFVYARMMRRARTAIRKVDPHGRVGFDGPFVTDSVSGNDWWQLMQAFDLCNVYFHEPDEWEHVRSFAKPGMLLGLWYGGYRGQQNEDYSRFFPWRAVLNGYNSVWWYAVYHGLSVCPMDAVTPSMTMYPYFAASAKEVREIKAGVGKALMNAVRQDDGIAVHYSQSSLHASTAYAGVGLLYRIWRQWYALLEDMGFQYACRSYEQIAKDGIDRKRFPVLILPYSQAVSPLEAKQMEAFVRAGGTLIADLRPAIADHHGKLQPAGLLDHVFGVRRTSGELDVTTSTTGTLTEAVGSTPAGMTLERITVDPSVALANAQALGEAGGTPLLTINRFGEGRAILLNFAVGFYTSCRNDERAEQHWSLFRGLMAMAGVAPSVHVRTANGEMRKSEIARYRDGEVEYVGFLKYRCAADEPPQDGEVSLDTPAHTYDVRTGEYLGNVARFPATFEIERGKLYARLPYEVESISLEPTQRQVARGRPMPLELGLKASRPNTGRHWFRIEVFGPDGTERRHYAQNVAVVDGSGNALVPFALNDPTGEWRITARDVASGVRGEVRVKVR